VVQELNYIDSNLSVICFTNKLANYGIKQSHNSFILPYLGIKSGMGLQRTIQTLVGLVFFQ